MTAGTPSFSSPRNGAATVEGAAGGGALAGIRVLDFTSFIAGPYAGMLLADLGAEVIKVEAPPRGDPSRYREDDSGYSSGFAATNRNKESLLLDLKSPGGQEVLRRLVADVDVLLISLRPRSRAAIGLSYEQVSAINPRLVYCSLTGLGETDAARDKPAFDTTAQALSGLLSLVTGDVDSPVRIKAYLADQLSGLYGVYGILGALVARERTGRGQEVRTSLLQASIAFCVSNFYHYWAASQSGDPEANSSLRTAGYLLRAGDGLPFAVHVPPSPAKNWIAFTDGLGRPDLRQDPRFSDKEARERNYETLHGLVAEHVKQHPRAYWLGRLEEFDVPCAPIYGLGEVFLDPLVTSLGILHQVPDPRGRPRSTVGAGVSLSATPTVPAERAPLAGEHNRAILARLGFGPEEIEDLERRGVIAGPMASSRDRVLAAQARASKGGEG